MKTSAVISYMPGSEYQAHIMLWRLGSLQSRLLGWSSPSSRYLRIKHGLNIRKAFSGIE